MYCRGRETEMRYLYDSRIESEIGKEGKKLAKRKGIELINTANWSDEEKWNFYLNKLLPLSVMTHKKLRGRVRTHKAGMVHYSGVLLTEDDFFVGEEAIKKLKEI